ncbi:MAG TPA: pyridoxamine 5'-phosphate oxidase family protein [Roseiarcus sp.]|nr:pyridoxamine 5'-phosphate oxidase family protein [Roseiarcus sp.]
MAKPAADPDARALAVADAKRLLRLARTAALATLDPTSGAPLATLVGVASDFSGAPLFLMSTLARHTRHLAADPRASLLLTGEPERGDPLNHPRITLNGRVEPAHSGRARIRYLQRNPKAKLYADFADFAFFRLAVESVHFNGGFGRADALTPDDILIPCDAESTFAEAEPDLLAWANGLGDAALARLAGEKPRGRQIWKAIGLDAEGLDLAAGGETARVAFGAPASNETEWRKRATAILAQ